MYRKFKVCAENRSILKNGQFWCPAPTLVGATQKKWARGTSSGWQAYGSGKASGGGGTTTPGENRAKWDGRNLSTKWVMYLVRAHAHFLSFWR
jgi:hypothetical protein